MPVVKQAIDDISQTTSQNEREWQHLNKGKNLVSTQ
jgi:hypothetical protein